MQEHECHLVIGENGVGELTRIALIEPFFTSSHQQWAEQLTQQFPGQVDLFTLPGRHWKWRMHGGAVTLAEQFNKSNTEYDLILASDMLDLCTFLALTREKLKDAKVYLYMHENQLTYPWSPSDQDVQLKRDNHYAFINYTSTLAADKVFFNSNYHRTSFLSALADFLKQFPDHQNHQSIQQIEAKSKVLYLGLDLKKFDQFKHTQKEVQPLILWNHRWEYDKNPAGFLELLRSLKLKNFEFKLAVLGESYAQYPSAFDEMKAEFSEDIVHWGYVESFEEYTRWLWRADILPVTSNQDFFGISVVEAAYCNTKVIAPDRLAYPEYVDECNLYSDQQELLEKAIGYEELAFSDVNRFDWAEMRTFYLNMII